MSRGLIDDVQGIKDHSVNCLCGVFNNPFMIWGKYRKKIFRYYLPVSFQFHHTQMDGDHAGRFLENLQADTFGECAALVIEYSASENLQMEFYRDDYLDGSYSEEGRGIPGFLFSDDEENEHRFAFAGYVDKDFNDQVELELLSYGMASL